MAIPAYTTDLTLMADYDTVTGTIAEPTSTYTAGRSPDVDTDYPIEGTVHLSETFNTVGLGGALTSITAFTLPAGEYIFGWLIWTAPSTIATQANGGLCMLVGSGLGTFYSFYVGGSDFGSYPYGGWQNFVVDPTGSAKAADRTIGTAPTSFNFFGIGCDCITKVAKGNPMGNDVFRYGRGQVLINGGQSGSLANFAGIAAVNDPPRWGLFATVQGGYQWKGLLSFGPTSLTEFTDSNISIVIENTEYVTADFNRIEMNNASSIINWTNVSFTALGITAKGELEMIDNCVFNDTNGTFTGMSTFIYQSNYTAIGRTWRNCGQVTLGGATMTGCTFASTSAAIALACGSSISTISDCTFESDGSSHGIEITSGLTHTLDNLTFTGYEAYSAGGTSTGNEAVYINIAAGSVTLYTSANISYRTAGATVSIVVNPVDTTVTAIDVSGADVDDVSIALYAKDATGDLPFQEAVTISNSGTTATVTHTSHGMVTNDKVLIQGGDQPYNRGAFTITVTGINTYTYITSTAPSGNPTGCLATWTSIYETLSGTNTVTKSRTFTNPQPVSGWVRKSTTSPLYQTAPITGVISTTLGINLTGLLLSDE